MGMVTNGGAPAMLDDFENECETMLKPLERTLIILNSNPVKRFFIDFALRFLLNNGRQFKTMNGMRKQYPKQFELFLKHRYEYVYEMS